MPPRLPLQMDFALQKNRQSMGRRYIEVFRAKKQARRQSNCAPLQSGAAARVRVLRACISATAETFDAVYLLVYGACAEASSLGICGFPGLLFCRGRLCGGPASRCLPGRSHGRARVRAKLRCPRVRRLQGWPAVNTYSQHLASKRPIIFFYIKPAASLVRSSRGLPVSPPVHPRPGGGGPMMPMPMIQGGGGSDTPMRGEVRS